MWASIKCKEHANMYWSFQNKLIKTGDGGDNY